MLELSILSGDDLENDYEYSINVSAISGGVLTNYSGTFFPSPSTPAPDDMRIDKYPRWSEGASALCARFLAKVLRKFPHLKTERPLNSFVIVVRIVPHGRESRARLLEKYAVSRSEGELIITGLNACWRLPSKSLGVCAATLDVLKETNWAKSKIPKANPMDVPIHQKGNISYINMDDIPKPAHEAFCKNMAHSGRPIVAGVRHAAYSWDWTDFLAGSR